AAAGAAGDAHAAGAAGPRPAAAVAGAARLSGAAAGGRRAGSANGAAGGRLSRRNADAGLFAAAAAARAAARHLIRPTTGEVDPGQIRAGQIGVGQIRIAVAAGVHAEVVVGAPAAAVERAAQPGGTLAGQTTRDL